MSTTSGSIRPATLALEREGRSEDEAHRDDTQAERQRDAPEPQEDTEMSVIESRAAWLRGGFWVAGLAALLLAGPAWGADAVLKRKNVDNLTPAELAAYEHAVQIMKDRSA